MASHLKNKINLRFRLSFQYFETFSNIWGLNLYGRTLTKKKSWCQKRGVAAKFAVLSSQKAILRAIFAINMDLLKVSRRIKIRV